MSPDRVYIKNHPGGAGKWIYLGYQRAWESLGYKAMMYNSWAEIDEDPGSYYLMALDGDVTTEAGLNRIRNSYRSFVYTQPNEFPPPRGNHPNFKCLCPDYFIEHLNDLGNTVCWSFSNSFIYHTKWKKVYSVPLAFDNISYETPHQTDTVVDAYFVGGWADNGFDEKRSLMISAFKEFEGTKLKCGIFINKSLTHAQETELMYRSKVALNIHDAYQRELGTDVNERTFKALGSTGILVSDNIKCLDEFNFNIVRENDPRKYVKAVEKYVFDTPETEILNIREYNINEVLTNHTYVNRVKSLLEL